MNIWLHSRYQEENDNWSVCSSVTPRVILRLRAPVASHEVFFLHLGGAFGSFPENENKLVRILEHGDDYDLDDNYDDDVDDDDDEDIDDDNDDDDDDHHHNPDDVHDHHEEEYDDNDNDNYHQDITCESPY